MKNIRKVITIFCLLILYAYFININNFPDKIVVHENSLLDYKLCPFLNITGEVQTISSNKYSSYELNLSLGNIDLKKVNLTIAEDIEVVPIRKNDWIKNVY